MSRKPEATFRAGCFRYLPNDVYHEPIGSGYVAGTPDTYVEGPNSCMFVEWKNHQTLPKLIDLTSKTQRSKLSPMQQKWLRRAHGNGQKVAVIMGHPDGGLILPGLEWEKPLTKEEVLQRTVSRKEVAQWIANQVTESDNGKESI